MERAIEIFAALNFVFMGLSHVVRHRAWAEFFVLLHRQGRPGAFAHGFLSLFTGTLIVAFHNVWSGLPILLTITGWLFVVKSIVVFLFPDVEVRSLGRVRIENSRMFVIPGAILAVLGVLFGYTAWNNL